MPSPSTSASKQDDKSIAKDMELIVDRINTFGCSFEKKIRNLEKRKIKLQSYQEKKEKGETITTEQTEAMTHFKEVNSVIEFGKEMIKNFNDTLKDIINIKKELMPKLNAITTLAEKTIEIEGEKNDNNVVRDLQCFKKEHIIYVLKIQDALQQLGNEEFRNSFLDSNQLSIRELEQIDSFFQVVTTERQQDKEFSILVDIVSNHFLKLFNKSDDKIPEISCTYNDIYNILQKVLTSVNYENYVTFGVSDAACVDSLTTECKLDSNRVPAVIYGNQEIYSCPENDPDEIVKNIQKDEATFMFLQDSLIDDRIPNNQGDIINSQYISSNDVSMLTHTVGIPDYQPSTYLATTLDSQNVGITHPSYISTNTTVVSNFPVDESESAIAPPPIPLPQKQDNENRNANAKIRGNDKYRGQNNYQQRQYYTNNQGSSPPQTAGSGSNQYTTNVGSRNGYHGKTKSAAQSGQNYQRFHKSNSNSRNLPSNNFNGNRVSSGRFPNDTPAQNWS